MLLAELIARAAPADAVEAATPAHAPVLVAVLILILGRIDAESYFLHLSP